jgi:hypothetical protein
MTHRFSQHFTRDIDGAFDGSLDSGELEFDHAFSRYGLEEGSYFGTAMPTRRDVSRSLSEINAGGSVDTLSISGNTAKLASIDMQRLVNNAGGKIPVDGLWGSTSNTETARVAKELGFKRTQTPFRFDFFDRRTKVLIEPADLVRRLQQEWDKTHASADIPTSDLIKVPVVSLRLVLCILRGVSRTGGRTSGLGTAYKDEAKKLGLPVKTYENDPNSSDKIITGPQSTWNAMLQSAAAKKASLYVSLSADELRKAIKILAPKSTNTEETLKKFGCKATCGLPLVSATSDPKTIQIQKKCWDLFRKAADAKAKKDAEAAAKKARDALFDKSISAKDLEKWILECGKTSKFKPDGKWTSNDKKRLKNTAAKLGITSSGPIETKTKSKGKKVAVRPKGLWKLIKKCADDEKARKKKAAEDAAKKKKAAEAAAKKAKKAAEDAKKAKDAADKAAKEKAAKEAAAAAKKAAEEAAAAEAKRKEEQEAAEEEAEAAEKLDTEEKEEIVEEEEDGPSGVVVGGLLAGLAGLGLVLFAAQKKKK